MLLISQNKAICANRPIKFSPLRQTALCGPAAFWDTPPPYTGEIAPLVGKGSGSFFGQLR
jgi:hypothetical protein